MAGLPDCYGTVPNTLLTAVGPRTATNGSAMVAGIGGLVIAGGWPDGILGQLQLSGEFGDLKRLPGTNASGWCDSWPSASSPRASLGQCVAWVGAQEPAVWDQFTVIGSTHDTGGMITDYCVDAKLWDFCRWTTSEQVPLIRHCRGCPPGGGPDVEPCAQISRDELWHSFATNIRLSSFVPPDPELARPLALGGLAGVRTVRAGEACDSDGPCAMAHAVAVISSGGLPSDGMSLIDLHTVLPWGTPYDPEQPGGFLASGIARLLAWPRGNGDVEGNTVWVAVGAVGNNFEPGFVDETRRACIWLGRVSLSGETQWCALDVNELTIRPPGVTIEALHDMTSCGLAVGVASELIPGGSTKMRLVYLTEAADLDGDLAIGGGDLNRFLSCWRMDNSDCSYADLDRDGIVAGNDFALLLAAWGPNEGGCEVGVSLICDGSTWRSPLERYPYIDLASQALGFDSLDDLGTTASLLPPESALGLCEMVDVVARALEGAE